MKIEIVIRRIPGGTMWEAVLRTNRGEWPLRASSRREDVADEGMRAARALGLDCQTEE